MSGALAAQLVVPTPTVNETYTTGLAIWPMNTRPRTTGSDPILEHWPIAEHLALPTPLAVAEPLKHTARAVRLSQTSSFHLALDQYSSRHEPNESATSPQPSHWYFERTLTLPRTLVDPAALLSARGVVRSSCDAPALQVANDLNIWLRLTGADLSSTAYSAKQPAPDRQEASWELQSTRTRHPIETGALAQALRQRLSLALLADWFHSSVHSRLELLRTCDIDTVRSATLETLFPDVSQPMARSTQDGRSADTGPLIDAQDKLASIEPSYVQEDSAALQRFLTTYPKIRLALHEISTLIPAYFPKAPLYLRVLDAAPLRDAPEGRRLLLFVATDLAEEQAMDRLDRLIEAWHPDVRSRPALPFSVGVAFGATDSAVDRAAQQFIETHRPIRREGHYALARRLRESEPGSPEDAIARADLAASLAADQGIPLPVSGGDALAVLARLRRQAGTQP
jgi:hypothetical protein